ncbi:PP2C family protein-serine/threonine phosphatase [Butyrivibrio sp. VCB2006]|uniref:PP2C family protein-serine/threonine phosphatase n=1 Tax=Butyrivibrio sp. VCB2006 TaxID=1280679 RepID=UPI0004185335|nr:PP2C family serine/threonine-protein phosphatase [Butyrivibrio sp. VCB2006]
MKVKACICTDVGTTREINQDAALIKVANTRNHGRISLIAICDGMGGLSKGEVASCKAIRTLESWFHEELSLLQNMSENELWDAVESSFDRMVRRINGDLKRYGKHRGVQLGTTLAALIQIGTRYMTVNVGDSRIYAVRAKEVERLTKDQSVVQDKLDKGIISESEALEDQEKSVLLQCLGTSHAPEPEVRKGQLKGNTTIVACSDGFWRTLDGEQLRKRLCPQMCLTDEDMLGQCKKMVEAAKDNREDDNISVAAMCLEM